MDTKSQPKFKKGNLVKFKTHVVNEMRERIGPNGVGPFPFGRLILWTSPYWNGSTWMYEYEYGSFGDHEGFAREEDIELYSM